MERLKVKFLLENVEKCKTPTHTSDFDMYVASQAALVPWFFVLDHVNYSRWLPVHVCDMVMLQAKCPYVYREFQRGAFTAKKTKRPFSAISLDQAREQVNALVKGDGELLD